jgi:mono/diheme cytochrome c family protein
MARIAAVLAVLALAGMAIHGRADEDARARVSYLLHCGGCHLPDGRGAPPEVPALRGEIARIAALPEGRRYLVRVPGASQAPLSDAELAAVINWILVSFAADGLADDFVPLNGAEVGAARRDVLADPLQERARLWRRYLSE